jgi:hypothetical protein
MNMPEASIHPNETVNGNEHPKTKRTLLNLGINHKELRELKNKRSQSQPRSASALSVLCG